MHILPLSYLSQQSGVAEGCGTGRGDCRQEKQDLSCSAGMKRSRGEQAKHVATTTLNQDLVLLS